MLTPTHIQVAVLRTKDLIFKGKNCNDAFIIYSLGKEKYQSSIKEKVSDSLIEWNEGCDIAIPPSTSNKSELVLKVMHKASIGDKFLGRVSLPISEFDVTAKLKPVWYQLKPKPGAEKDTKYRGEIEVRISFLIKSLPPNSSNDLSKKRSGSLKSSLGSILSLGKSKKKKEKRKNSVASQDSSNDLTASRLGLNSNLPTINDDPGVISEEEEDQPIHIKVKSKRGSIDSESTVESLPPTPTVKPKPKLQQIFDPPKPRPKSEPVATPPKGEEYDNFDEQPSPSPKQRQRLPSVIVEESPAANDPPKIIDGYSTLPRHTSPSKLTVSASMSNLLDASGKSSVRIKKGLKSMFSSSKHLSVDEIFPPISNDTSSNSTNQSDSHLKQPDFPGGFFMKRRDSLRDLGIPKETYKQFERKSKEELVAIIVGLQTQAHTQKQKISDLEDYIDTLLLRVLDKMPDLLKKGSSMRVSK